MSLPWTPHSSLDLRSGAGSLAPTPSPSTSHPLQGDMGDEDTTQLAAASTPAPAVVQENDESSSNGGSDTRAAVSTQAVEDQSKPVDGAAQVEQGSTTTGSTTASPTVEDQGSSDERVGASTSSTEQSTTSSAVAEAAAAAPAEVPTSTAPTVAAASVAAPTASLAPAPLVARAPSPSVSPAPAAKRFQSSLSVNRKFLEKASTDVKKEQPKVAVARTATPPAPTPVSASHPRLLTGKISSTSTGGQPTSSSASSASTAAGGAPATAGGSSPAPTGWLKTAVAASAEGVQPPVMSQSAGSAGFGERGLYDRSRGIGGMGAGGQPSRGWGSRGGPGGGNGGYGPGGEFPTAAEAANAKNLRAQAILEQMQSRDRAVQARAAAAAAANAHLLQGLDAFRGVHLDPNASHWDEDVDDDFLDDTIEFGDGTQYKISEETAAATPPATDNQEELREPHPSDMARREAPPRAGEKNEPVKSREERFKDDYDRSYKRPTSTSLQSQQPAEGKNLFNERLGKFEPYSGGAAAGSRKAGTDLPPHLDQRPSSSSTARRPSVTSPPAQPKPTLPSPNAWGAPRAPVARRPSIEHHVGPPPGARRSSNEPGLRRPSLGAGSADAMAGGRQLPPHLAGGGAPIAQQPTARRPSTSAVLSPPSRSNAPLPPIADSPAPAPHALQSVGIAPVAPTAPAAPAEDLESLHAREMHAAAERAKKRRQEEEQARLEQMERARKKAQELEEKMKAAQAPKVAAASAATGAASKPASAGGSTAAAAPTATAAAPQPPKEVDSWRKPLPKSVIAPPPNAPAIPTSSTAPAPATAAVAAKPSVRPEPTRILSREPQPPAQPPANKAQVSPLAPLSSAPALPAAPALTSTPSAPRAPLEPQDRAWRRADAPSAPQTSAQLTANARSQPPAVSTKVNGINREQRQLPPHLSQPKPAPAPAAPSAPPAVEAQKLNAPAEMETSAPTPAAIAAPAEPSTPKVANSSPIAPTPSSPHAHRKGTSTPTSVAPPSHQKGLAGAHRGPEVSQFEDLMSRIKGAMNAPAPQPKTPTRASAADGINAETVSTSNSSPVGGVPTVRLPAPSSSAHAPATASNFPTPAPSPPSTVSKPPFVVDTRGVKLNGAQQQQQQRGRNGEPTARKVSARGGPPPPPPFESREPLPLFERSRAARSPSPSPVWKRYTIALASHADPPLRSRPTPQQISAFKDPRKPLKVNLLSWTPPINLSTKRLSRDDLLHPKKYIKGVLQCPVSLPKTRIQRRDTIDVVERKMRKITSVAVEKKEEGDGAVTPRGRGRGRAPEEGPWRRVGEPSSSAKPAEDTNVDQEAVEDVPADLNSTTAPPAADLFNSSPSTGKRNSVGAGLPFYRPSSSTPNGSMPSSAVIDRSFMVTSGLDGEVVNMGPRESLAAPGADTGRSATMTPPTSSGFESQPQGINSPSAAWNSNGPLSLSVLDPTVPSVWSAPSSEVPVHSRSISLGATKQENSLQGVADDDFPAPIPSSLADLKSEDDALNDTRSESGKQTVQKDEARLRAAAPSFSSFSPQAGTFDTSRTSPLPPHYPSFAREASPIPHTYPSLTGGPSPHSYGAAPPLHSLHGYAPATPQHYPSFAVPSHSTNGMPASYGQHLQQQHQQHQQQAQLHPSYAQSPFSSHSSPFPAYRPQPTQPQGITNPALLANHYGASSYQGGAFGAVGAGGGRSSSAGYLGATPGGYGRPIPSPYQAGSYRHDSSSSFGGSPHEIRSPLPFLNSQPSPVLMPQQQPSPFVQHQQLPYGSTTLGGYSSPQMQGANLYGRGGAVTGAGMGAAQGYRRTQW